MAKNPQTPDWFVRELMGKLVAVHSHLADSRWTFNANGALPTFRPSLLVPASASCHRCHSFVTDGKIQYLGDCTHTMAGQTVDLPEFE